MPATVSAFVSAFMSVTVTAAVSAFVSVAVPTMTPSTVAVGIMAPIFVTISISVAVAMAITVAKTVAGPVIILHPDPFFIVGVVTLHPNLDRPAVAALLVFPVTGHPTLDRAVLIMPVGGVMPATVADLHTAATAPMSIQVMPDAAHDDPPEETPESRPTLIARFRFGRVG